MLKGIGSLADRLLSLVAPKGDAEAWPGPCWIENCTHAPGKRRCCWLHDIGRVCEACSILWP
ncbi:hypothetical protein [Rhizohabitans arisaemae]|uniref:hypothetical protein n=1 Tax=Rhizohabitans arisaemae TaxID=2720610 RepID=UPI0024B1850C|nr:hypothetical protein [Rhizohabitans arisaemae]